MQALSEDVWALRAADATGTVIRLSDGRLWVCVATPPEDLSELGEVAHLVVADARHAGQLARWVERHPEARCWTVGLEGQSGLPLHTPFSPHSQNPWQGELELFLVRGSGRAEAWFVHPASGTAILPRAPDVWGRWAFFGLRRHVGAAVRWLEAAAPTTLVDDQLGVLSSDVADHLRTRFAWVGADGPIPPAMRFAVGANPGGPGAFAVALAAVVGLLAGLTTDAPSLGVRVVTALVLGDVACGAVAQSLPSTQAWWSAGGPWRRAALLGLHIAHPLVLVLFWEGSVGAALGLWAAALVAAAVPRSMGIAVVVVGAVIFGDLLPGPSWWPALYLLKLSSGVRPPPPADVG